MPQDTGTDLAEDNDIVIGYEERDGFDVYRITKGTTVIGEFTGPSIGSTVFQVAVEHTEPGRSVWLKDELGLRRLFPTDDPVR
jgi:hypothetical protein